MATAPQRGKAVWITAPRTVELRGEDLPPLGVSDVGVRAVASAISHGTEMMVYRGQIAPTVTLDLPTLAGGFGLPIKYGYALAGVVEQVGADVHDLVEGDRVFLLHPHQSRLVVPRALIWPLPSTLPLDRAVFAANVETALNALLDQPVRIGETVVVFGQGTVGLVLGMLARRNGAGRLVVVEPHERRRSLALELGADVALAPTTELRVLRQALPREHADVVFESSGSPVALQDAVDIVSPEGTVVVTSWYGTKPVNLDLGGHFHRGRVRIRSSQVGAIDSALAPRWDFERRRRTVIELLEQLPLDRLISHRFALSRAEDAYRLIDQQSQCTTQVLLTYGAEATSGPA